MISLSISYHIADVLRLLLCNYGPHVHHSSIENDWSNGQDRVGSWKNYTQLLDLMIENLSDGEDMSRGNCLPLSKVLPVREWPWYTIFVAKHSDLIACLVWRLSILSTPDSLPTIHLRYEEYGWIGSGFILPAIWSWKFSPRTWESSCQHSGCGTFWMSLCTTTSALAQFSQPPPSVTIFLKRQHNTFEEAIHIFKPLINKGVVLFSCLCFFVFFLVFGFCLASLVSVAFGFFDFLGFCGFLADELAEKTIAQFFSKAIPRVKSFLMRRQLGIAEKVTYDLSKTSADEPFLEMQKAEYLQWQT